MPEVKFEVLHMPPENTNSVLVCSGDDCVIFDAWGRASDWIKLLDSRGLRLRAIYTTHGHDDHLSAAPELARHYGIDWFLNEHDVSLVLWGNQILDFWELPRILDDFKQPKNLTAGTFEILPGVKMDTFETPGHSLGGMCFYFPEYNILLTGDTLFRDGVGRNDLPGGSIDDLRASIKKIILKNYPDETYVVHGHGADSMIKWLKENHPWFIN